MERLDGEGCKGNLSYRTYHQINRGYHPKAANKLNPRALQEFIMNKELLPTFLFDAEPHTRIKHPSRCLSHISEASKYGLNG